jgi:hypothetical protein
MRNIRSLDRIPSFQKKKRNIFQTNSILFIYYQVVTIEVFWKGKNVHKTLNEQKGGHRNHTTRKNLNTDEQCYFNVFGGMNFQCFWRDEFSIFFRLEIDSRDGLIQRRINFVSDKCLTISISSWLIKDVYRDGTY